MDKCKVIATVGVGGTKQIKPQNIGFCKLLGTRITKINLL